MAKTLEFPAHVAGKRADVSALAASGFEGGRVLVRSDEGKAIHHDGPQGEVRGSASAGKVIGPFAIHLDGGKGRRRLHDLAGEVRQDCRDLFARGPVGAHRAHRAFHVIGGALLAPLHREAILLLAILGELHRLRGLAKGDGQKARGERIKSSGMAAFLGMKQPLHDGDRLGGIHAIGLVENEPAVDGDAWKGGHGAG